MTASVPVHRLHVYVRRLVEAGYKVCNPALPANERTLVAELKHATCLYPPSMECPVSQDCKGMHMPGSSCPECELNLPALCGNINALQIG